MELTLEFRVFQISNHLLAFMNHHSYVPLSELVCRTHDTAMQTQSQGHTSRSWNSAKWDMAVLQTAVLFKPILSAIFVTIATLTFK